MMKFSLTFDVEEFFPLGRKGFEVSKSGLKRVIKILNDFDIPSTMFFTKNFAKKYKSLTRKLSGFHEIALHSLGKDRGTILDEKRTIESITNKKVLGIRTHRFVKPNFIVLRMLGFAYDSSIHPTFVPFRYNNLMQSTRIQCVNGVYEIPVSVSVFKIPVSFVWFRVIPLRIIKKMVLYSLNKNGFINVYFHPWEFTQLKGDFNILLKINTGDSLVNKLNNFLEWAIKRFEFAKLRDIIFQ